MRRTVAGNGSGEVAALAALLAAGIAIRVWIAFTNYGVKYDIDSLTIVGQQLASHPLHVYSALRWPYPGGFFPVILAARALGRAASLHFWAVIKLPAILADAGIAAVIWWALREQPPVRRWAAVALVALGPSFVLISGYHGQIDSTAILPALIAVLVWRGGGERRALVSGLLIGIGASIKTVPLFMVLAMLPTARSRREAGTLVAAAVLVPLVSVLPFLLADGHSTVKSLSANKGIPGWGGLSLLAQPALIKVWLDHEVVSVSPAVHFLYREQNLIVALAVLGAGAFALWRRLEVVRAAALIWAVVYVTNPDLAFHYFVWGLPFFLLAGWIAGAAILEAALALPAAELYFRFGLPFAQWLYVPLMDMVWVGLACVVVFMLWQRGQPSSLRRAHEHESGRSRA